MPRIFNLVKCQVYRSAAEQVESHFKKNENGPPTKFTSAVDFSSELISKIHTDENKHCSSFE